MGTQQSGLLQLKIADIVKDKDILLLARNYAQLILKKDPNLQNPENKILQTILAELLKKKTIWNYIS
jgi:ATP-dependent DNA helicase RecG